MSDKLSRDCAEYFKNNAGFKRSMEKIREKYESLGHLGGSIKLSHLSHEEKEALSGYFGKNFDKKSVQISTMSFVKALDGTRFEGAVFTEVLEYYFGEKLQSKKERQIRYDDEKKAYFDGIVSMFEDTPAGKWLSEIMDAKNNAYRMISLKYDEDKTLLKKQLKYVCEGFNKLPWSDSKIRLALFASRMTKDPHAFDRNRLCGKLLLYAIAYKLDCPYPENAEEQSELMYKAGLIIDELSNFTMCSGIKAWTKEGAHEGWSGFSQREEPLQVSLLNLSPIEKVNCNDNRVYVFENPTVFSEVLYRTQGLHVSMICTYGQLRLASLVLLDKVAQGGAIIYYSGDFDPEGIMIADKLKQRYREALVLWRYGLDEYHDIQSKVKLTDQRLRQLKNLKSVELKPIAEEITNSGYGAYQELLTEDYVQDITGLNKNDK